MQGRVLVVILSLLLITSDIYSQRNENWSPKNLSIPTRWTTGVSSDSPLPEYPRPQLVRKNGWRNLNGKWNYKITQTESWPVTYDGDILVPFPIESSLSGVKRKLLPTELLWYRKKLGPIKRLKGEKVLLHFGAIDWQATVYLNNVEVGRHTGGYTEFTIDLTKALQNSNNELLVKVYDPTDKGIGPHGKQVLNPQNIYYTSCSGIWQTAWLETVPEIYVKDIRINPDLDKTAFTLTLKTSEKSHLCQAEIVVSESGKIVANVNGPADSTFIIKIENPKTWSPASPFLYDFQIRLKYKEKIIDQIDSYAGMRKIEVKPDNFGFNRIYLNNKYIFNLGVLDQGYWPDGIYTAPTDSALCFDLKAIKAMGFNTIRKHIKIEPARWYYYTDKLGLLVWQDFVNPNQKLPEGAKIEFENELKETIDQLYNHPSIISWVLFNERWGQYDQGRLTKIVKDLDPSRLLNGHSGELLYVNNQLRDRSDNPYQGSDMADVHSYPFPRNAPKLPGKVQVLGEFGGIGVPVEGHFWDDVAVGWGYQGAGNIDTLKEYYRKMTDSLVKLEKQGLSASIFTQPFDVESEQNGLITYDRAIIKINPDTLRKFNSFLWGTTSDSSFILSKQFLSLQYLAFPTYSEKRTLFENGRRDSTFLRNLGISAVRHKDTLLATRVTNQYLKVIKDTFATENLKAILFFTNSTNDSSFRVLLRNRERVNAVLGKNTAERYVMRIISSEYILPYLNDSIINWGQIEKIIPQYGELAEEEIFSSKMISYLNKKDWNNFSKYYMLYYKRAMPSNRSKFHVNNMSWQVFLNSSNPEILKFAAKVMEKNIEKNDANSPEAFDTYANLLYKIGNRSEALIWERKAFELSKNPEIKQNLDRMIANQKTWE
ncbi:glycosyl hydrolase 2 galactose-binding domain-containing protein [Chitinophaga tropicalis]|nr:sugar-binding domain-containing protein [Chitinophaga tropicalis]